MDDILGATDKSHTKRQTDAKASGPGAYSLLLPVLTRGEHVTVWL
jgi:hypothetical protein